MRVRLYQPAKTAMSSGTAKSHIWILEYAHEGGKDLDPLMGWTSSADTQSQVRLQFDSLEAAQAYAEAQGLSPQITLPQSRAPNLRAGGYGENFSFARREPWSH